MGISRSSQSINNYLHYHHIDWTIENIFYVGVARYFNDYIDTNYSEFEYHTGIDFCISDYENNIKYVRFVIEDYALQALFIALFCDIKSGLIPGESYKIDSMFKTPTGRISVMEWLVENEIDLFKILRSGERTDTSFIYSVLLYYLCYESKILTLKKKENYDGNPVSLDSLDFKFLDVESMMLCKLENDIHDTFFSSKWINFQNNENNNFITATMTSGTYTDCSTGVTTGTSIDTGTRGSTVATEKSNIVPLVQEWQSALSSKPRPYISMEILSKAKKVIFNGKEVKRIYRGNEIIWDKDEIQE